MMMMMTIMTTELLRGSWWIRSNPSITTVTWSAWSCTAATCSTALGCRTKSPRGPCATTDETSSKKRNVHFLSSPSSLSVLFTPFLSPYAQRINSFSVLTHSELTQSCQTSAAATGETSRKKRNVHFLSFHSSLLVLFSFAEVLLYVHRNRSFIRNGSPGRPSRLSHSSWAPERFSLFLNPYNHTLSSVLSNGGGSSNGRDIEKET